MPQSITLTPSVLIIEDDLLIAALTCDVLQDAGYVAECATTLEAGLVAADKSDIDVAILDLNLNGKLSYPIAAVLQRRNIPHIFTTGSRSRTVSKILPEGIVLTKPYTEKALLNALRDILATTAYEKNLA